MSILNFSEFINETKLNLGELDKPINGKLRGDILINKLKNKEPLSTDNGNKVIDKIKDDENWVEVEDGLDNLTNNGNYDSRKAKSYFTKKNKYINTFKDINDDEYKLNQFNKTTEFGSKGPGRLTKKIESLQCIFLAIKQDNPNILLSFNNMFKLYEKVVEDNSLDDKVFLPNDIKIDLDLVDDFSIDNNWSYTFSKVPNRLWSFLDENGNYIINRNIKYKIFHVGYKEKTSPYININKKYKEFINSREIDFNKYCPADVYMVDEDSIIEINKNILKTENIIELTNLLDSLFDDRKLIPISLKKIIKPSDFKIIINKEIGKDLPFFFIDKYIIGCDFKGIGSKIETTSIWKHKMDKNVDSKKRTINFDSSDTSKSQNVDGEVEGSSSRHGKISFNWIKRILDPFCIGDIDNIQGYNELKNNSLDELRSLVIKFTSKINKIKNDHPNKNIIIREVIRGVDISNDKNKLISRIQSLQII